MTWLAQLIDVLITLHVHHAHGVPVRFGGHPLICGITYTCPRYPR